MGDKITFADLVGKIAEESGASKRLIRDLLKETVHITEEGLARDGRVHLSGLGYFNLKWSDARRTRHPRSGETIQIPAQNRVKFNPEAAMRNYLNRQYDHLKPEIIEEKEPVRPIKPDFSPAPVELRVPRTEPNDRSGAERITEARKTKKIPLWAGLIALLIAFALVAIYWPFKEMHESVVSDTNTAEHVEVEIENETQKPQLPMAKPAGSMPRTPGGERRVQTGDTLWYLAQEHYSEPYLWPNIFRVNLTKIKNPDALPAGIYLIVPSLEGKAGSLTDKDIEDIAAGYLHVYLAYKKLGKDNSLKYLWVAKKCDVPEVINRYMNEIDKVDLKLVSKIVGILQIR
jgi:nucleoid DNA-binding protein